MVRLIPRNVMLTDNGGLHRFCRLVLKPFENPVQTKKMLDLTFIFVPNHTIGIIFIIIYLVNFTTHQKLDCDLTHYCFKPYPTSPISLFQPNQLQHFQNEPAGRNQVPFVRGDSTAQGRSYFSTYYFLQSPQRSLSLSAVLVIHLQVSVRDNAFQVCSQHMDRHPIIISLFLPTLCRLFCLQALSKSKVKLCIPQHNCSLL